MVYEGTLQEKYIGSCTSQPQTEWLLVELQGWGSCESHHLLVLGRELRSYLQLSQCRRSNEGQLEEEEANLEEEGCTPQKGKIRCQHVAGSVDPSQEVDKVTFLHFSFLQTEESKSDVPGIVSIPSKCWLGKKRGKNSAACRF